MKNSEKDSSVEKLQRVPFVETESSSFHNRGNIEKMIMLSTIH